MKKLKAVGEELLNRLKSKTILKRKPRLKLCSNHFKTEYPVHRIWTMRGQAIRDGKGWYKEA